MFSAGLELRGGGGASQFFMDEAPFFMARSVIFGNCMFKLTCIQNSCCMYYPKLRWSQMHRKIENYIPICEIRCLNSRPDVFCCLFNIRKR